MTQHVRIGIEDGILRLTLARPDKKNALTSEMYAALAQAINDAQQDPQIRVILLDAEGDTYCAGNDLADFSAVATGTVDRGEMKGLEFLESLARATKPCVAAVQGPAVGVGMTMLLHCDLVYVAEDARLMAPFVNLGTVPEGGSTQLLPARIGYVRSFALFAFGEPMDGRTAASLGLANAAVPALEVRQKALAAAKLLAAKPPGALQATKALLRDGDALTALMQRENEVFGERLISAEAAEAFKAFAERRPPDFSRIR